MNPALDFLVYVLATWRLSSLMVRENGPFRMFARMRTLAGADEPGEMTGWAELFSCVWCMSVWMAGVLFVVSRRSKVPLYILAASAGAILADSRAPKV